MRRRRTVVAFVLLCLSLFVLSLLNVLLLLPAAFAPSEREAAELPPKTSRSRGAEIPLLLRPLSLLARSWRSEPSGELAQELRARRAEISRLRRLALAGARPGGSERRLMELERRRARRAGGRDPEPLDCADIDSPESLQYVGGGFTKAVYKAVLGGRNARPVALKTVDLGGRDMATCVQTHNDPESCYRLAAYKLLKEMTLLSSLQHPNVVQICLSLARLLQYLAHSPLGSVALLDFRPRQFVLRDGELKISDMDDATAGEPRCTESHHCTLHFSSHNFSLPCSLPRGRCLGLNERRNLYNAHRYFLTYLLPHSAPSTLRPALDEIVNATGELRWSSDKTFQRMACVLHSYQNGWYRMNTTKPVGHAYMRLRGVSISQRHDYRCMPSYHSLACLLSILDTREAMEVCDGQPKCRAFVFTGQTTWTGRHLVFFKTGANDTRPDPDATSFVRT
uniref:extracellular tyrosine-protein kinase PKDCC isoform X2 n=1 Tax=Myxine glutinosa TaxID=7769 RepID=UPI00358E7545